MALNETPYEVMYGPCEVWLDPDTDKTPPNLGAVISGGSWVQLGTNGEDNMPDDGLTIGVSQQLVTWRPITKVMPTKVRRTSQEVSIRFALADVTVSGTWEYAIDDSSIATTAAGAGTVGHKDLELEMGPNPHLYTMVVRFNQSPYGMTSANTPIWRSQAYFPAVYSQSAPEAVFRQSGDPAMVAFDFRALSGASFTNKPKLMQVHAGATS